MNALPCAVWIVCCLAGGVIFQALAAWLNLGRRVNALFRNQL
jgi:hypothetical protein